MARFLLFVGCLLVISSLQLSAQRLTPSEPAAFPDSVEHVAFGHLSLGNCGSFLVPNDQDFLVLRDSASFTGLIESKRFIGNCKDTEVPHVDFTTDIVIGFDLFFDCNAQVFVSVVKDTVDLDPQYYVYVDMYDGMCRGMTSRSYWLAVPVQDKGASVQFVKQTFPHQWRNEKTE